MNIYPAVSTQPLRIWEWPHPVLCQPSGEIKEFDSALETFVMQMWVAMHHARGVGLAAPQVGVSRRVFVMDCSRDEDGPSRRVVCVNPQLHDLGPIIDSTEGCLSFPGLSVTIPRHETVTLSGYDEHGTPFTRPLDGLDAICAQHEIDHLDGRSFLDRLGPLEQRATIEEYIALLEDHLSALKANELTPEVRASMTEALKLAQGLLTSKL